MHSSYYSDLCFEMCCKQAEKNGRNEAISCVDQSPTDLTLSWTCTLIAYPNSDAAAIGADSCVPVYMYYNYSDTRCRQSTRPNKSVVIISIIIQVTFVYGVRPKLFCMQLMKAYVAKTSCYQLLIDSATSLLPIYLTDNNTCVFPTS